MHRQHMMIEHGCFLRCTNAPKSADSGRVNSYIGASNCWASCLETQASRARALSLSLPPAPSFPPSISLSLCLCSSCTVGLEDVHISQDSEEEGEEEEESLFKAEDVHISQLTFEGAKKVQFVCLPPGMRITSVLQNFRNRPSVSSCNSALFLPELCPLLSPPPFSPIHCLTPRAQAFRRKRSKRPSNSSTASPTLRGTKASI